MIKAHPATDAFALFNPSLRLLDPERYATMLSDPLPERSQSRAARHTSAADRRVIIAGVSLPSVATRYLSAIGGVSA